MITVAEPNVSLATRRQWWRVAQLFYSPNSLGEDIRKDVSWWLPFLITVIFGYGLSVVAVHLVGFEQLTSNIMRAQGVSDPFTSDPTGSGQVGANFRNSVTVLQISTYAAPLIILLYNLAYAMVLQLAFRMLVGVQVSFNTIFAVLLYCDLIQDIRTLLSTIVLFLGVDPSSYNLQNPVGTNVGYYIGVGYPAWVRVLFEAADIVTLWYLIVIALGCASALKVEKKSTFSIVFGLWLLVVAIRTMWAAVV